MRKSIYNKEFYFIRHGQTDYNADRAYKYDHHSEVSLNQVGRDQAAKACTLVDSLQIQTVCCSPMKRAQETKEMITANLKEVRCYDLVELGECTSVIWRELSFLKSFKEPGEEAKSYLNRVKNGLDRVLSFPAPALIVSHGGVHLALCYLLAIQGHDWIADNCTIIHFFQQTDGVWKAKKMIELS